MKTKQRWRRRVDPGQSLIINTTSRSICDRDLSLRWASGSYFELAIGIIRVTIWYFSVAPNAIASTLSRWRAQYTAAQHIHTACVEDGGYFPFGLTAVVNVYIPEGTRYIGIDSPLRSHCGDCGKASFGFARTVHVFFFVFSSSSDYICTFLLSM